jgi:thymidylate synthase (FAD)
LRIIDATWNILKPASAHDGIQLLQFIESMARISHKSEDRQTPDSWRRFLNSVVISKGDWSVVEHASATVLFRVNRGVTHELVRHRLFSFTQESTRFVNGRKSYPEGLEFIPSVEAKITSTRAHLFELAEHAYLSALDDGERPQEARDQLPNALASTIAVTGNLRQWRHLFIMRTTKETHPDFRNVTLPLLDEMKYRVPLLYDDILPMSSQAENLKLPR